MLAKSFDFIIPNENAAIQSSINEVKFAWNSLLSNIRRIDSRLYPLIKLCMEEMLL